MKRVKRERREWSTVQKGLRERRIIFVNNVFVCFFFTQFLFFSSWGTRGKVAQSLIVECGCGTQSRMLL